MVAQMGFLINALRSFKQNFGPSFCKCVDTFYADTNINQGHMSVFYF